MKNLKIAFLFFFTFILLQFSSCSNQEKLEKVDKPTMDSISYYVQQMKDRTFPDSICLNNANLGLNLTNKIASNSKTIEGILAYKTYLFGNLNQLDSAIHTSKKLINLVVKNNDTVAMGLHYARLGYYYYVSYQRDSAYLFYNNAKEIHLKLGDSAKIGSDLALLAIIQSDLGDYQASDKNAIEALKYLHKENIQVLTSVYNCIAINSKKQQDYTEAIYWYSKAIEIAKNDFEKLEYLINKAVSYRYLEEYNTSINLFHELLKDSILNTVSKYRARVIDQLAYTKWLQDKNRDVLSDLENALSIRQQEKDIWGLNVNYAHLSDYFTEKNPKIALNYAHKMLNIATTLKSPQDQLEALEKIINLDNLPKVKGYYASYIRISDSLHKAEKSAQNKFAKLKYDSKKNREENLELRIMSSQKELALKKEKTRNIIGAFSSGTLVIGLLIFVYYRKQKHQQEKRAEVYKTETRIAKKIHDELANNVVNIMNKVQYTEEPKEVLLDDLEKVYLLTRDISHQNNTIETGSKFENSLKTLLTSFNSDKTSVILKDIRTAKLAFMSNDKQIEIYRVLQELLVNMQKHSGASLVVISFKNIKNQYFIKYSDNGVGLEFDNLTLKNGLQNVETRIKSLNGSINFETSLNNGFKAFIRFKK